MQRNDDDIYQLSNLPRELFPLILDELDMVSIASFSLTTKKNAAISTDFLRDPIKLLSLLSRLPKKKCNQFIKYFYSPGSGNYKAIEGETKKEYKAINPNPEMEELAAVRQAVAIVCFAFITNDVTQLNWEAVKRAVTFLKEKELLSELSQIENGICLMESFVCRSGPKERGDSHDLDCVLFDVLDTGTGKPFPFYLNLSGADLSKIMAMPPDGVFPGSLWMLIEKRSLFSYANLRGANLRHTWLATLNLEGTNLINADLTDAGLDGARLYRADLRGANITISRARSDLPYSFSRKKSSPPIRDGIQWKQFINVDELSRSPESLKNHLAYLSQIKLDKDEKFYLQQLVLERLIKLKKPENIPLLETASKHLYFTVFSNKDSANFAFFLNPVANIFGAKGLQSKSKNALEDRIDQIKEKMKVKKKERKEVKEEEKKEFKPK